MATTEESSVVQLEGRRHGTRQGKHYNLDAVISGGYRVNSKKGVQFRQWATGVLRQHLLSGYPLNQKRFEDNARELEKALHLIRKTAERPFLSTESGKGLVDVVTRFTRTFLWLKRYDEGLLTEPPGQEGGVLPTIEEARQSNATWRKSLIRRGEAGNLFGQERGDSFLSIWVIWNRASSDSPLSGGRGPRLPPSGVRHQEPSLFGRQQTGRGTPLSGLSEPGWPFDAGGWKSGHKRCGACRLGPACWGIGPQGQGCFDQVDHEYAGNKRFQ